MDTTEIIIITIAIVLLLVALFTFNYFMTSVDKDLGWPPYESNCPDFWEDKSNGVCYDRDNIIDPSCVYFKLDTSGNDSAGSQRAAAWGTAGITNDYLLKNDANSWADTSAVSSEDLVYNSVTEQTTFPDGNSDYNGVTWNTDTAPDPNTASISVGTYAYFDPEKKDKVEMKNRKQWAKRCGLTWSGVTNTNH